MAMETLKEREMMVKYTDKTVKVNKGDGAGVGALTLIVFLLMVAVIQAIWLGVDVAMKRDIAVVIGQIFYLLVATLGACGLLMMWEFKITVGDDSEVNFEMTLAYGHSEVLERKTVKE
jgi:apolipoprotein N-acyltransferase